MSELVVRPILAAHRADGLRLSAFSDVSPFRRDLLFGDRSRKRPLIAITTKKDPGPVRHALSQMVVAGTMTVHQSPAGQPPPPPGSQPRVLTFTPPPVKERDIAPLPGQRAMALPPQPPRPPVRGDRKVVFDFNNPDPNQPEED